jgi:hypothetical protein
MSQERTGPPIDHSDGPDARAMSFIRVNEDQPVILRTLEDAGAQIVETDDFLPSGLVVVSERHMNGKGQHA